MEQTEWQPITGRRFGGGKQLRCWSDGIISYMKTVDERVKEQVPMETTRGRGLHTAEGDTE